MVKGAAVAGSAPVGGDLVLGGFQREGQLAEPLPDPLAVREHHFPPLRLGDGSGVGEGDVAPEVRHGHAGHPHPGEEAEPAQVTAAYPR